MKAYSIASMNVSGCCEIIKNHVRSLVFYKPTLALILKIFMTFQMCWKKLIGVIFSSLQVCIIKRMNFYSGVLQGIVDAQFKFEILILDELAMYMIGFYSQK